MSPAISLDASPILLLLFFYYKSGPVLNDVIGQTVYKYTRVNPSLNNQILSEQRDLGLSFKNNIKNTLRTFETQIGRTFKNIEPQPNITGCYKKVYLFFLSHSQLHNYF